MTTAPVMAITDELLSELECRANACMSEGDWYTEDTIGVLCGWQVDKDFVVSTSPATILAMTANIRSLSERLEKAEKDAERYRWLRDRGDSTFLAFSARTGYSANQCDVAIDAAIAQEGQSHE